MNFIPKAMNYQGERAKLNKKFSFILRNFNVRTKIFYLISTLAL